MQQFITQRFCICTLEILAGPGEMYVADKRFRRSTDKAGGEGTAEFVRSAIRVYCKKRVFYGPCTKTCAYVRSDVQRPTVNLLRSRWPHSKQKNAYRSLPLSADAIDVLEQQKKKAGKSVWVFPSPAGGPMSPDSVLHKLQRVLKRASLPRIRFHDLRHTFATMALQNGVDVKTVSSMLGHYSAGFTLDTYAHVTTDAQRQAAQTMGNILSGTAR